MAKKSVAVKKKETKPANVPAAWQPFAELRTRMDDLFDDFTRGWGLSQTVPRVPSLKPLEWPSIMGQGGEPLIDVHFEAKESDKEIDISAELPGLDDKDVEVTVADGLLTIKGEKKIEAEKEDKNYHFSERRYGSFTRSFRVPDSVDESKIKANLEKGVLNVSLPKRPEAMKKKQKIAVTKS